MSEQSVPGGARGAVDLGALSAPKQRPAASGAAGRDPLHVVATDATFTDIVNGSVRVPAVVVVVSTRQPESVVYLDTVIGIARRLEGRLQVVSVDVDANPQLSRALQAQQVPVTFGLIQGQLVPMFAGALPADQIRPVFDELLTVAVQEGVTGRLDLGDPASGDAGESDELPPLHQEAFDAIEAGDLEGARAAYEKALRENPKDQDASLGLAQVGLMARTADVDPVRARAIAAAEPDNVAAQTVAADLDLLGGHVEDAFLRLVDLVRRATGADREAARLHLISLFEVIGNADDRVRKARTALMSALF